MRNSGSSLVTDDVSTCAAVAMVLLGGSGIGASMRKDAASMKSLNLTAAAVIALMASAFVWQVRTHRRMHSWWLAVMLSHAAVADAIELFT